MKYLIILIISFLFLTNKKKPAKIEFDQGDGNFDFPNDDGNFENDDYEFDIDNKNQKINSELYERENDSNLRNENNKFQGRHEIKSRVDTNILPFELETKMF